MDDKRMGAGCKAAKPQHPSIFVFARRGHRVCLRLRLSKSTAYLLLVHLQGISVLHLELCTNMSAWAFGDWRGTCLRTKGRFDDVRERLQNLNIK